MRCKDKNNFENTQIYFAILYENTQIKDKNNFENTQI